MRYDISDFLINIYHFSHDWLSHWDDSKNVQKKMKVPQLHFFKHINSWWLTIESVTIIVLQQWDAIIEYFLNYGLSKISHLTHTTSFKRIVFLLKKRILQKQNYNFVIESAHLFSELTGYFQKEEPLIHVLYGNLKVLLEELIVCICKDRSVRSSFFFLITSRWFLPSPSEIILSKVLVCCLQWQQGTKITFFLVCPKHFISAARYIMKKIEL